MRFIIIVLLGLSFNLAQAKDKKTEAAATAAPAPAPAAAKAAPLPELKTDLAPFELNMARVDYASKGKFGDESKLFIVPTYYLRITARTQTEISSKGSSGASVKAKILIDGLNKNLLQKVAATLAEDLEKKIKAAGLEVIPYSQVAADLSGIDKMSINEKFGFPTNMLEGAAGVDFAIITPSDERTFDYGFTGVNFKYRDLVKAKKATVIIPEVRFTLTEVGGTTSSNSFAASANANVHPNMNLDWAYVSSLEPDHSGGAIRIQRHGAKYLSTNAGTTVKIGEDSNSYAGWARTVGDFTFTIDQKVVSEAMLAVGYAINDLTVKTIKGNQ